MALCEFFPINKKIREKTMTEIANIRELKNCGLKNNQANIDEEVGVFVGDRENELEISKGFAPIEAEAGFDYQSMS